MSQECRLLIIDDQWHFVEQVEGAVSASGFSCQIKWASTFNEARDFWREWDPHLVLLDVHMPPTENIETAFRFYSYMLRQFELVDTVVVFVSIDFNSELVSGALSVGARYLDKLSLDSEVLTKLINEAISL